MGLLDGKVAVVTGAGRGIGRGVALALAAEGAKIVVNDYGVNVDGTEPKQSPAQEVVEEIKKAGGNAVSNFDSVALYQGGENIIKTAVDNFGKIDILVNVAGILRDRMIFNMTEEEWDAAIAVHLKGTFNCTKFASILMRQQRSGRIISFTSSSGLEGNSGQAKYGAAKAGIAGFTRVVARDLGRYGITANAISPAAATRMTASVPGTARDIRSNRGIVGPGGVAPGQQPQRPVMIAEAEDVAPIVVYLASDAAANINGQIFYSRGGDIGYVCYPRVVKSIHKEGRWTIEELMNIMPRTLEVGLVNPAPPTTPAS
ncbi:MAG: SDR family oxidoreductase [Chloroflexi bacterium]|nr:SDR family oxidoreductase [Chloroflexota bacterium]